MNYKITIIAIRKFKNKMFSEAFGNGCDYIWNEVKDWNFVNRRRFDKEDWAEQYAQKLIKLSNLFKRDFDKVTDNHDPQATSLEVMDVPGPLYCDPKDNNKMKLCYALASVYFYLTYRGGHSDHAEFRLAIVNNDGYIEKIF